MTKDQLLVKRVYWPKILIFVFAIVLPQCAIAWSNREVFPDALWIATIFVIVIIGISAVSTYFSGNADKRTRRYAMFHDLAVALLTCIVGLFHFQVAREVSAGKDARAVQERKDKEGQEYADRDTHRRLALAKAKAEELREQRRLAIQLPPSQRRFIDSDQPQTTPTPFSTASATNEKESEKVVIKSPEEVRASWFSWLFYASAFEIIIAVLGGMILMMIWQWDVDGDGITDKPGTSNSKPATGFAQGVPVTATEQRKPTQGNYYYTDNSPK